MTTKKLDILGFGPIGRELALRLVALEKYFEVRSISDSSATILPKESSEIIEVASWKAAGQKLANWEKTPVVKDRTFDELIAGSDSSIIVDVTNSDYSKADEVRNSVLAVIDSRKHLVTANKVAFANFYSELMSEARQKEVRIGFTATILGARYAIEIAKSMGEGQVNSASAVLNSSTTLILSKLEQDPHLGLNEACEEAAKAGTLESDWSIDLDGIDAAAKTAILDNVLFPDRRANLSGIIARGIRDQEAKELIEKQRKDPSSGKIRLVSRIEKAVEKSSVSPVLLPNDSPLAVGGRYNAVLLETENFGEVSVKNTGGGVSLTTSALILDLQKIPPEN